MASGTSIFHFLLIAFLLKNSFEFKSEDATVYCEKHIGQAF